MKSIILTLLAFLLAGVLQAPAHAQTTQPMPRIVSVSGEGIVRVLPDMATLRFGVVTRDANPEEARRRNAEAARNALNAVRALGVEERKIRLETLYLQPVREYNPETRRTEEKGFEAVRDVVVEVNDLDKLPEIVARVVQQGANRLNGIQYDLSDRDKVRNEALLEAIKSARTKAALLVGALDARLGQVMQVNEQSFDFPRPMPMMRTEMAVAMKDAGAEPEAYASGEIEVRATVQVIFALQ